MGVLGLSWINYLKAAAAIAASSEADGLPAGNLIVDHLSTKWRSAPGTAADLTFDLGAPKAVRAIGVFGSNLTTSAQWSIRLSSTGAHAGDLYNSGALATAGFVVVNEVLERDISQAALILPAAINARYAKISLSDAGLAAVNYVEAGAVWVGDLWQPTWTRTWGAMDGLRDEAEANYSQGGQKYVTKAEVQRVSQFTLDHLTDAERYGPIADIDRRAGRRENILLVPSPNQAYQNDDAIFGTLSALAPVTRRNVNMRQRKFEIEERL
jgi:hypothetical protein